MEINYYHPNYATIEDLLAQADISTNIGNLLEIDKPAMQQEAAQNILKNPKSYHHWYVTKAKNIVTTAKNIPKSGGSKKSKSKCRRGRKLRRRTRKH